MCTLIIATRVVNDAGLYVIANRDEALDRSAEPPTLHRRGTMDVLAPRDLKAKGTWLGLNESGVFAGITNRFRRPTKPHHKTRGELPFRALEQRTAREAADAISALDANDYNGFHLVMADRTEAFVVWNDGNKLHRQALAKGYHAITERSFDAGNSLRLERMQKRLATLGPWTDEVRQRLQQWMVEHDEERRLESTCVHLDSENYGTRSSTIIELGQSARFAHANGPPCTCDYRDYPREVEALDL